MEHFSCAKCEKPFLGGRHFEKAGLAYCETHFLQLFGSVCYVCDKVNTAHYTLTRFRSVPSVYEMRSIVVHVMLDLQYLIVKKLHGVTTLPSQVIKGDVVNALNKSWCSHHFACSSCDRMLKEKSKFYEVDLKPVCKKCYDRFPRELKLRLKQYHEMESAKGSGVQVN